MSRQRTSTGAGTPRRHGSTTPPHSSSSSSRPGGATSTSTPTRAPIPRDADANANARSAERHRTTQLQLTPAQRLIERYERMSTPPPPTPPAEKSTYRREYYPEYRTGDASSERRSAHNAGGGGGAGIGMKKDRSPIRQSLKNLFSVLKKGAGGLTKRRPDERDGMLGLGVASVGAGFLALPCSDNAARSGVHPGYERSKAPPPVSLSRAKKKMTGSLHYLTSCQDQMAWTPCSVTLEPESHKILVSSFTTASGSLPGEGMELYVHEIALSRCINIRSLSTAQLTAAEAKLLLEEGGGTQDEGERLKAFEILFEEGSGRMKERFAARSVRERAGWISAIWDAILPSQEDGESQPRTNHKQDNPTCAPSVLSKPLSGLNKPISPSYSDRSLPALPPKSPTLIPSTTLPLSLPVVAPLSTLKKVPHLHLDLSEFKGPISPPNVCPPAPHTRGQFTPSEGVISPSIYPPTSRPVSMFVASPISPTSGLSVGTGVTNPNSPSIRNLSQLSVVRQRLAQIERNHSELSAESRYSSACTTPTSGRVSPAGSGWSKGEAIFYNAGRRKGPMSISSSKTASSKLVPSLSPLSTPDPSKNVKIDEESGHGKEDAAPSAGPRDERTLDTVIGTADLCSKDDMRKLSRDVADIRNVLGKGAGARTVHDIVIGLEQRAQGDKKDLRAIKDTLKALGDRVAEVVETTKVKSMADASSSSAAVESMPAKIDDSTILKAVNEVKERLYTDLPVLVGKLQDIKDAQEKDKDRMVACSANANVRTSSQAPIPLKDPSESMDHKILLDKLEEIRKLCQPSEQGSKDETIKNEVAGLQENLTKLFTMVQEDGNKQTLLAQQQADSVRYLNELNSWLEAFVNNGTSQIQSISANIDRLCNEMGAGPIKAGVPGARPSLVNDIRQLVEGMKARDQNLASLQAAVHSLLEVLTASQTQHDADSQAIAGLMDRQRHAQEVMFRAFTNEISDEIKGERLRFVDAMKEATAINVQLHVEQFKQELTKEVMSMTEEVGRLHREKQQIENQISDLFSFYSKHKQAEMPLQVIQQNTGRPVRHPQETPRPNIPRSSQHRALPNYPRPQ